MTNKAICLDKNYSTSRIVTKDSPIMDYKTEEIIQTVLFLPESENREGEGGLRTKGYFKKSYEDKPLVSIVTVVYNGEKHLEQTIQSVINQTYDNIEYIIIDGGSNDGTIDIIKKYEDYVDYWVSEPDNGVYSAMNKGISLCTGNHGAFLNADDWYNEDTIKVVTEEIKNGYDYICGDTSIVSGDTNTFIKTMKTNIDRYKTHMPFGHPSLFVNSKYLRMFAFDEKYSIIADYDFAIKLIEKKLSYVYIRKSFTNFRMGGMSTLKTFYSEHFHLFYKHFGIFHAIKYSFLLHTKYGQKISSILDILWKKD